MVAFVFVFFFSTYEPFNIKLIVLSEENGMIKKVNKK